MANRWWEITVKTNPELEEIVFWRLQEFGCQGTASVNTLESLMITGYVPAITVDIIDLAALSLWLHQDFVLAGKDNPKVNWQLIDEEDWASSWKEHWQPLEIGDRLLIYPAWLDLPEQSERMILRLDPGAAFGTGVHPTTQLCLESLEMRLDDEDNELIIGDIGCGSGILSIASILFGAKEVYAVDTDPLAVKATQENSFLNTIKHLNVAKGSMETLRKMTDSKFDGIVCNILANVIQEMIPEITEIIKPKGWVILSGILIEQSMDVVRVLEKYGWLIAALWKREGWCCINARR